MDNQELKDYIERARQSGMSEEQIQKELLNAGWSEQQLAGVLRPVLITKIAKKNTKIAIIATVVIITLIGSAAYAGYYFFIKPTTGANTNNRVVRTTDATDAEQVSMNQTDQKINEPETTTYAIAQTLTVPYKCSYTSPSFFGEYNSFEAEVLGDDFLAVEVASPGDESRQADGLVFPKDLRYAKKDGWAYFWLDSGNGPELADGGGKFNYQKVRAAVTNTTFTHFENFLIFTEPAPNSECSKIDEADIVIPNLAFEDHTDSLMSEMAKDSELELNSAESVPADRYLPPYANYRVQYWVSAKNQGLSDPNRYSIGFRYLDKKTGVALYDIEETKVSERYYNPPADCRQIDSFDDEYVDQKTPCTVAGTSKSGVIIYRQSNKVRDIEFFFSKGSALFTMRFYDSNNKNKYDQCNSQPNSCNLAPQELSLIDSFEKIDIGSVLNYFEQM